MSGRVTAGHHNEKGALDIQIDHISRNLIAMGPEHQMTHEAKHFLLSHYFSDIDTNGYGRLRFLTSPDMWLHLFFFASASLGATFAVYEDPGYAHDAGNVITPVSRNRSNILEDNGIAAACHTPSGAGPSGTLISPVFILGTGGNPSQANPGTGRDANEYLLAPDTAYMLELQSLSDNNKVTIGIDYYVRSSND